MSADEAALPVQAGSGKAGAGPGGFFKASTGRDEKGPLPAAGGHSYNFVGNEAKARGLTFRLLHAAVHSRLNSGKEDPDGCGRKLRNKKMSRMTGLLKNLGIFALFALIIYMFYKSIFAFVLLVPAIIFYIKYDRKNRQKKEILKLQSEFRDALTAITAALRAGYSVENSIYEALGTMKQLHGENSAICRELTVMTNELSLGVPAADVFDSLAKRCNVEDISTFASVFRIAKRSGGDMVEIIRKTSDDISAKVDSRNEIAVMVSEKKLEQNIMSIMPLAILVYIDFTSSDLLAPLYGNFTGVCIMTACLAVYIFAYWLGQRILNIDF